MLRFLWSQTGAVAIPRVSLANLVVRELVARRSTSGSSGGSGVSSSIAPECITVETVERTHDLNVTDVVTVDTFAKSKVLNFLKSLSGGGSAGGGSRTYSQRQRDARCGDVTPLNSAAFETNTEQYDGRCVYRSRIRLPLPTPHGVKVAEGIGDTEKDAEVLAAMHAERVIDALGIPLHRLPSAQQKHAERARKQGRWAPMPGDAVRPEGTPVPPMLRMLTLKGQPTSVEAQHVDTQRSPRASMVMDGAWGDEEEAPSKTGRFQVLELLQGAATESVNTVSDPNMLFDPTEGCTFQLVNTSSFRCSPHDDTIVLPCVFDRGSLARVKARYSAQHEDLESRMNVSHVMMKGYATRVFLVEVVVDEERGVVARGKAGDRQTAMHLVGMHIELLLDALGIPLFPMDLDRQSRHATAARGFGRWAPDPLRKDTTPPNARLPLPLKQFTGADDAIDCAAVRCLGSRSIAERIISAHNELSSRTSATVEVFPAAEMMKEARTAVREWAVQHGSIYPDLFVCTRMGDYVRASYLLPLPDTLGVRGGNGIGRSVEQAIDLCCLHAVDTLCSINCAVYSDEAKQKALEERRKAAGQVIPAGVFSPACHRVPYLPSYSVDGNSVRELPHTCDIARVASVRFSELTLLEVSQDSLIQSTIENKAAVAIYRKKIGTDVPPSNYVNTKGTSCTPAHNIVFFPVYLPKRFGQKARRVLAIGASLKKKDADRACYAHALKILEVMGVNPLEEPAENEFKNKECKGPLPLERNEEGVEEKLKAIPVGYLHPLLAQHLAENRSAPPPRPRPIPHAYL